MDEGKAEMECLINAIFVAFAVLLVGTFVALCFEAFIVAGVLFLGMVLTFAVANVIGGF